MPPTTTLLCLAEELCPFELFEKAGASSDGMADLGFHTEIEDCASNCSAQPTCVGFNADSWAGVHIWPPEGDCQMIVESAGAMRG